MSRFPTHKHFTSWAGQCPGSHESAGKRRSGKTPAANRQIDAALTEMAHATTHTRAAISRLSITVWRAGVEKSAPSVR